MLKPGMNVRWYTWDNNLPYVTINAIVGDKVYATRFDGRKDVFSQSNNISPNGWIILEQPKPANLIGEVRCYGNR